MSQDKSPESGNTDHADGTAQIICGEGRDIITIRREGGVVLILVEDEVSGPSTVAAVRQAIDAGILTGNESVLVDMTKFVGTIDWGAIHTVREMKMWNGSGGRIARVAFLVRDSAFASLVTLAGALFPHAMLRLFTDRGVALDWMKAPRDR